ENVYAVERNSKILCNILIIFPIPPEIIWNGHRAIGPIGPLKENSVHEITCLTRGGRPSPSLVWWLEGHKALNQRQEIDENGEVKSILTLKASRELNMKTLSCHAQIRKGAAPITQPLTATVRLNVTRNPLGISIEGGEHPVPVDTTLTLLCLSWGSYPPADITWWKLRREAKQFSNKVIVQKDKPSVELRVKLSEEQISNSEEVVFQKRRNVVVKQGSHVRLECSSNANPYPDYIEWHQNGVVIESGKEAWSFLLESVTKENSGVYTCAATNSVGRGISLAYSIVVEHMKSQEGEDVSLNSRATLPLIGIFVGTGGVLIIASLIFLCFFCVSRGRFFDWGKKSHRSSMNHQGSSHTIFYSPSMFDQSQESELSLNKERLIPDPDIVSCIQYGSRASSHRGLDVLPPGNLCQPLISHSERALNLSIQDGSSLERISSQSLTSKSKHFDDEDSIITVVESCSFKPKGYSSQDEFRQTKRTSLVNHISEEQQQLLQQVIEKSYVNSNPAISNGGIDSSFPQPSIYDSNSTYTLCLGGSNSMCNQCLENISNYQLQNPDLMNMNSTDSLTCTNSSSVEHGEQYYLYKNTKNVPHQKYYAQYDDMVKKTV
ncbi:Cell adhesion molecule 3, partial [Armadillidium vulgare]